MAKFELKIYDPKTGDVERTVKTAFLPVGLYVRFQKFAEKWGDYDDDSAKFFDEIKAPFLELFQDMTAEEFESKTDTNEVIRLWRKILTKATDLTDEENDSKNA